MRPLLGGHTSYLKKLTRFELAPEASQAKSRPSLSGKRYLLEGKNDLDDQIHVAQ